MPFWPCCTPQIGLPKRLNRFYYQKWTYTQICSPPSKFADNQPFLHITDWTMSSHRLGIEKGRHGRLRDNFKNRMCRFCCTDDEDVLLTIQEMPFAEPIIEDEVHVLRVCPRYYDIHVSLPDRLKSAIFQDIALLFGTSMVKRTSRFIEDILRTRFPKKEKHQ